MKIAALSLAAWTLLFAGGFAASALVPAAWSNPAFIGGVCATLLIVLAVARRLSSRAS